MIVGLVSGRPSAAVKPCQARIVVTVFDTFTQARVTGTTVDVKVHLQDVGQLASAQVQTDAQGDFTVEVDELEDHPDLEDDELVIEVADLQGEDRDQARYPPVQKGKTVEGSAYFGFVYEAEVVYRRDDSALMPDRAGEHTLEPRMYDEDSIVPGNHDLCVKDRHSLVSVSQLGPQSRSSKPEDYKKQGWIQHIRPTLRFEVRVTKRRKMEVLPIGDAELLVDWEVVDPKGTFEPEQKPMSPYRPVEWLDRFFNDIRGEAVNSGSYEGGYNCPERYGGLRSDDGGVPAGRVLFAAPGGNALGPGGVEGSARSLGAYDAEKRRWCSQVLFCPEPIGGDRYFFLVSLRDARREPVLFDHASEGKQLARLRTGTFTIWREICIKEIYKLPGVEDDFDWDLIQRTYEAAYIKVLRGKETEISPYTVRDTIDKTVSEHDLYLAWGNHRDESILLPSGLTPTQLSNMMESVTKNIISTLCTRFSLPDPNDAEDQAGGGHDFWMLRCKGIAENSNLAGQYIDNGQFFMVMQQDSTETFVHELGHALYLRHSLTQQSSRRRREGRWLSGDPVTIVPQDNLYDHDPADAVACVMSYANSCFDSAKGRLPDAVDWHFCAVCLLKLRFWDTAKLREDAWFRERIHEDLFAETPEPVLAMDHRDPDCQIPRCELCARIEVQDVFYGEEGGTLPLFALVRSETTKNELGEASWVDLRWAPGHSLVSSDTAVADAGLEKHLTLHASGQTRVTFEFAGRKSRPVTVLVRPRKKDAWPVHGREVYRNLVGNPPPGVSGMEFHFINESMQQITTRINGSRFFLSKDGVPASRSEAEIFHYGNDGRIWRTRIDGDFFVTQAVDSGEEEIRSEVLVYRHVNWNSYELRFKNKLYEPSAPDEEQPVKEQQLGEEPPSEQPVVHPPAVKQRHDVDFPERDDNEWDD